MNKKKNFQIRNVKKVLKNRAGRLSEDSDNNKIRVRDSRYQMQILFAVIKNHISLWSVSTEIALTL